MAEQRVTAQTHCRVELDTDDSGAVRIALQLFAAVDSRMTTSAPAELHWRVHLEPVSRDAVRCSLRPRPSPSVNALAVPRSPADPHSLAEPESSSKPCAPAAVPIASQPLPRFMSYASWPPSAPRFATHVTGEAHIPTTGTAVDSRLFSRGATHSILEPRGALTEATLRLSRFVSYATWPATLPRFASYAVSATDRAAARHTPDKAQLPGDGPIPEAQPIPDTTAVARAAIAPGEPASPPKKAAKKKTTRFHPSTKRGPTTKPGSAAKGGFMKPTQASKGGGGGRRGRRPAPVVIDLDVVGQTHRAYSDAKDAVRNRKPPQKPPERKEPFDQEAWTKAQMELTNDLNKTYNTKPPKQSTGGYVPKPRKTQRAVQKPRRAPGRTARNAFQVHDSAVA